MGDMAFGGSATPILDFTNKSGAYVEGETSVNTSATLGVSLLRAAPFPLSKPVVVTAIGAEYTVIGDVGSVFRMGIYADDGTGYPGALLVDAGSFPTDGVPGVVMNALAVPISLPSGIVWLAGAVQNVTTTQPTMRTGFARLFGAASLTPPAAGAISIGYAQSSISGALPATFQPIAASSLAGTAARIILRLA
jgi:hypothetical protein